MMSGRLKSVIAIVVALMVTAGITLLFVLGPEPPDRKTPEGGPSEEARTITDDETWSDDVLITEPVTVHPEATLTIEPGTTVEFEPYRGYREPWRRPGLRVEGTVRAVGEPDEQIWFTSASGDPINGDWWGISVHDSRTSVFDHVIVEYGEIGIEQFDSAARITNTIIRWNNAEGLYAERSTPVIENNTLYGNGYHEVALEQYNEGVQIKDNLFMEGHGGINCEETTANIEGNYFKDYTGEAIVVGMESDVTIIGNKFENIGFDPPVSVDPGCEAEMRDNDFGEGIAPSPQFDYRDVRRTELGYIPGDPEDRYMYVFDEEDESRRVMKRMGTGLSFGWALAWANGKLYRFSLGGGELGEGQDLIEIDPETGEYERYATDEIMNPRGFAYDGEYFWVNDFSLLKIFKLRLANGTVEVVDSFDIPDKEEGGANGLATDGEYLYLRGRDGEVLYRLDKEGRLIGEVRMQEPIGGALVWTGSNFWTADGTLIRKYSNEGILQGEIYAPAKETWALAWDGEYLWTIQRTCEMWDDPKIFQVEILDDSMKD